MKCYIDSLKTENNLDEIYKELVYFMDSETISEILQENKLLRLKCNLFNKKDIINPPKEKVQEGILELIKTNKELRNCVNFHWNSKIMSANITITNSDIPKIKRVLDKEEDEEVLFQYATLLWSRNDKEMNSLGDNAYNMYLAKKNNNQLKKQEVSTMDNILDISLGQILKMCNEETEKKQSKLEEAIKNNSNEIKKLSQQIKVIVEFNKDIKKLLNSITDEINSLPKNVKNIEAEVKNDLETFKRDLSQISNEIKVMHTNSEHTYKKELNTINNNIKGISEVVKAQNQSLEKIEFSNAKLKEDLDAINSEINEFNITDRVNEVQSLEDMATVINNKNEEKISTSHEEEKCIERSDDTEDLLLELLKDK